MWLSVTLISEEPISNGDPWDLAASSRAPGSPGPACHSWDNVLGNGLVVY